ncbi:ligase-associated DNA damage response endonuclease PdeM [Pararhizobium mangrovi]|nr:ligase-associated DNA damage response endonuclease PdeM [Pararhizobium mangrovi]
MAALKALGQEREPVTAAIEVAGVEAVADPLGALYLPASRALVVADLHLEKSAAFARRGMLLPPYDTAATLTLLEAVIARYAPAVVISLGDSFHDALGAAAMSASERDRLDALAAGRDWLWIAGNHDPDAPSNLAGQAADALELCGLIFRHEPSADPAPGEIAGHLHPAARVMRRGRSVRRACFATDGIRLVMPAFGVLAGGLDLSHPAMRGLFDRKSLCAHVLGRERVYSVPHARLCA